MKHMKVVVTGGRSFLDYELLCNTLDNLQIKTIIQGGAYGADALARRYSSPDLVVAFPGG